MNAASHGAERERRVKYAERLARWQSGAAPGLGNYSPKPGRAIADAVKSFHVTSLFGQLRQEYRRNDFDIIEKELVRCSMLPAKVISNLRSLNRRIPKLLLWLLFI